ncbi:MAG: AbrB/MazE/SpoVT family DNA-binding domain-containing protein [Deltaproteobacteria bacterium]|nr:AbrB/MazE/SpoVT family DNA-binding domain-containing protein [Deltaproteobacteria bacterium]
MPVAKISSKGQVTLPIRLRKKLGIKPQDAVVIEGTEDAILIRRPRDFFELKGFLGKALSEAEEREGMLRAVATRSRGKSR